MAILPLESTLLPAARVFIGAGDMATAKGLAAQLDRQLQTQTRAYAKIVEGEIALHEDRLSDAIDAFRAASKLYDVWLAHFDLGVAYVRAGHSAEAVSELDTCMKRRGEAAAIFLDDIPSFRYFAPLGYWLGRAQEGIGMKSAAMQNLQVVRGAEAAGDERPARRRRTETSQRAVEASGPATLRDRSPGRS